MGKWFFIFIEFFFWIFIQFHAGDASIFQSFEFVNRKSSQKTPFFFRCKHGTCHDSQNKCLCDENYEGTFCEKRKENRVISIEVLPNNRALFDQSHNLVLNQDDENGGEEDFFSSESDKLKQNITAAEILKDQNSTTTLYKAIENVKDCYNNDFNTCFVPLMLFSTIIIFSCVLTICIISFFCCRDKYSKRRFSACFSSRKFCDRKTEGESYASGHVIDTSDSGIYWGLRKQKL